MAAAFFIELFWDNSYLTLSILHDGSTKFVFGGNPTATHWEGAQSMERTRRAVAGCGGALVAVGSDSEAIPGWQSGAGS